ncbi:hypothetical protein BDP27DRAFT_1433284 [Rhodocollybia butyracea]|uniref:Uncharacterized protein n=1 Tax=Rhodocollybia butyracea TaxID=206335 RepID=A0A9P5TYB0_9AGAR|nr:hypothetical protein BDP27DRAFT_1433284 [Rhodocollybia butyracea]
MNYVTASPPPSSSNVGRDFTPFLSSYASTLYQIPSPPSPFCPFAASTDLHLPPLPPPKLPSLLLSTGTNLNLPSSSQPCPQSHSQPYSTVHLPSPSKRGSESTFDSEAHGYGYGYSVTAHKKRKETKKVHGHQCQVGLGVDDVYTADESLLSYYKDDESQYDDLSTVSVSWIPSTPPVLFIEDCNN